MNAQAQKSGRRARRPLAKVAVPNANPRGADHQVEIALAAYFIAEKRGFEPGHELDDWLAAEAQIDQPDVTSSIPMTKPEGVS